MIRKATFFILVLGCVGVAGGKPTSARPATVLLITDDALTTAWKPFAEWKTRLGKSTKTVTVQEIEETYGGRDIQEKIRACCLEHVRHHATRWVVLGGDSLPNGKGLVPDRDTVHRAHKRYRDIPTDLYYISEKDWDANGDGVYGDWSHDRDAIAYTNACACIGRIPVRRPTDVDAYTRKVIVYESAYPEEGFARNMVYTCPERSAYPKLGTSRQTLETHWKAGKIESFFAARTPWDGDAAGDYDLTPAHWIAMINKRSTSKLHVHGHGFLPVWILEKRTRLGLEHVDQLTNRGAYFAMTTVSCFTGQYDAKQDPSITEAMLRAPEKGAVVIVAPSREGVPVFHDPSRDFQLMVTEGKMDGTTETMTLFWKHALTRNLTAGEALRAAKAELANDAKRTAGYHFVQCELNLLGDPTLDLRAGDPTTPTLVVPDSIQVGKQKIQVATGAPGSTVCFWKGDEVYEVMRADARGKARAHVECETAGTLTVSVSGATLNAVTAEITVR
jgi:hypothetical protein